VTKPTPSLILPYGSESERICTCCQLKFPVTEDYFYKDGLGGFKKTCKACIREHRKSTTRKAKTEKKKTPVRDFEAKRRRAERAYKKKLLAKAQEKALPNHYIVPKPKPMIKYDSDRVFKYLNKVNRAVRRHGFVGRIAFYDLYLKMELQDWKCMYCETSITFDICEVDHIEALVKGGEHYLYNVVYTCQYCNNHKKESALSRFCKREGFDVEYIRQKIADINQELHDILSPDWEE
jgi:hypothetical protein